MDCRGAAPLHGEKANVTDGSLHYALPNYALFVIAFDAMFIYTEEFAEFIAPRREVRCHECRTKA
jgi:hypothetical protein